MSLFKNLRFKKKSKSKAPTTHKLIDISFVSPNDVLATAGSSIVGMSTQCQRLSRMAFQYNGELKRYGIVKTYTDGDTTYVFGTFAEFYSYAIYCCANRISGDFEDDIISILSRYYTAFTFDQVTALLREPTEDSTDLKIENDERFEDLCKSGIIDYCELIPIEMMNSDLYKPTVMAMAEFNIVGKHRTVSYVKSLEYIGLTGCLPQYLNNKSNHIHDLDGYFNYDDHIATEVIE